jgi:hypothetical protein
MRYTAAAEDASYATGSSGAGQRCRGPLFPGAGSYVQHIVCPVFPAVWPAFKIKASHNTSLPLLARAAQVLHGPDGTGLVQGWTLCHNTFVDLQQTCHLLKPTRNPPVFTAAPVVIAAQGANPDTVSRCVTFTRQ